MKMDILKYEVPEEGEARIDRLEEIIEELETMLENARWTLRDTYRYDDEDEFD